MATDKKWPAPPRPRPGKDGRRDSRFGERRFETAKKPPTVVGKRDISTEFLDAAKDGDAGRLRDLLSRGAPVNAIDPVDRATALHYIAAYRARPALRVVLGSGKCDFLIRDWEGRLPSEIAREVGHDRAMARLLLIKEMRQAQAQGIDPRSLYKLSSRKPAR
jgi:ankyrin repeat protein